MLVNHSHLRAMRLLPFAAATAKAPLTLKRQMIISVSPGESPGHPARVRSEAMRLLHFAAARLSLSTTENR